MWQVFGNTSILSSFGAVCRFCMFPVELGRVMVIAWEGGGTTIRSELQICRKMLESKICRNCSGIYVAFDRETGFRLDEQIRLVASSLDCSCRAWIIQRNFHDDIRCLTKRMPLGLWDAVIWIPFQFSDTGWHCLPKSQDTNLLVSWWFWWCGSLKNWYSQVPWIDKRRLLNKF